MGESVDAARINVEVNLSKRWCHRDEFAIAESLGTPAASCLASRTLRRVLDVGCGSGQTLVALELQPIVQAVWIDLDNEAIRLGKALDSSLQLVCGSGEVLRSIVGFVFSRVDLPYTNIPIARQEMARVITPTSERSSSGILALGRSFVVPRMKIAQFGRILRKRFLGRLVL
jgi:SAM-dependent methyltransferase